MDKNWMLNAAAIAQARRCIKVVQEELGVKLKLSHPQFLELIVEYVELTDSRELADAYNDLASFAGPEGYNRKVVKLKVDEVVERSSVQGRVDHSAVEMSSQQQDEIIEYNGKPYPRFMSGGEFKGLYRGQARYG